MPTLDPTPTPESNIQAGLTLALQAFVNVLLTERPRAEVEAWLERAAAAVQKQEAEEDIVPCAIAARQLRELTASGSS